MAEPSSSAAAAQLDDSRDWKSLRSAVADNQAVDLSELGSFNLYKLTPPLKERADLDIWIDQVDKLNTPSQKICPNPGIQSSVSFDTFFRGADNAACIRIEGHLVDNLKAKLLIGMDVMAHESFRLDFGAKTVKIPSCMGLTVSISTHAKPYHAARGEDYTFYHLSHDGFRPKQAILVRHWTRYQDGLNVLRTISRPSLDTASKLPRCIPPSGNRRREKRPQKCGKIPVKSRASGHTWVKKTVSRDHLKDYKQHSATSAPTLLSALAGGATHPAPAFLAQIIFITILGIIEDQLNQSNPNVIIWHARMGTTPTSFAALSKLTESTSGSSLHWTTYLFGISAMVWGLNGLIIGPERGFGTVTLPHDGMWAFDIALSRRSFSRRVRLRRRVLSLPKESRYGRGCAASGFTGHQIGQATVCPTGRSVQDMALCLDSRRLDDLAEAASSLSGYRVCHDNHRRRPSQSRYAYPYSNAYRCPSQTLALATSRLRLFRSTPSSAALTMLLAFA
ncbi:hypothetical protein N7505_010240 [Penicillium chrysogenum]|uniref:Uncharacterized protein n=1 Tax=Penicillium chrysogenum TaxID=5076 RepID=A0ABQ8W351_PENCH|nr:hypothetical protein N7505_010240 [Penicillium chrysogenum]